MTAKRHTVAAAANGKARGKRKGVPVSGAAVPRASVPPPADPAASALPLLDPNFSWDRFEEFCHHFVSLQPNVTGCHRYGTRGSDQKGIDLAADRADGTEETYQCRQYRRFDAGDVVTTVAEHEYKADRHTILVASVVGTPVRDEIKKHRKWRLLDATDIAQGVRMLDAEHRRTLVAAHFGPEWAEKFLGTSALATFQSPGLFYAKLMDRRAAFHHDLALVGRDAELDDLYTFVGNDALQVYLLSGVGGRGKSRLAIAAAAGLRQRHPTWHVRVVTEGLAVTPTAARELPVGDCLIVVEDAHRRDDLDALLSLARQRPGRTKLLLLTRPHGVPSIDSALAWSNVPATAVARPRPLVRLEERDRIALATAALGPAHAAHAAALAAAADDSPLVILVGAHLIASAAVHPAALRNHEVFRRTVFDRFVDEASARFAEGTERDLARKLLRVVAAVRPVRTDDPGFVDAAAAFAGTSAPEVTTSLALLERYGVMDRVGRFVQIAPDLLADHVLRDACMTATGSATGYAERVYDAFAESHGATILRNLAELDWRYGEGGSGSGGSGRRATILGGIWNRIRAEFDASPHSGRARRLESLGSVAFVQPAQVLAIVEAAVAGPSPVPETGMEAAFGTWSHERVLARVPQLLGQIAYHPDHLPRCAELLWRLGRDDRRDVNGDHPLNVLRGVAGYALRAPAAYADPMMTLVERWSVDAEAFARAHTPLDVLDALLVKTAGWFRGGARHVTYNAFSVDPASLAAVYSRALALLGRYVESADARAAKRAVDSLGNLMAEPTAPRGGRLSDAQVAPWDTVRNAALDLVGRAAAAGASPLVAYAAREVLVQHARFGRPGAFRDRVAAALTAIGDTYELRLARAVFEAPWDFEEDVPARARSGDTDYRERERRHAAFRLSVAREFLGRHPDAEAAGAALDTLAVTAQSARLQTHIGAFWESLTGVSPAVSAQIVARVITGHHAALVSALDVGLRVTAAAADVPPADAEARLAEAVASTNVEVRRAAAVSLWHRDWPAELSPAHRDAFSRLLHDADAAVRRITIGALPGLTERHRDAALELLAGVDFGGDANLANEAARVVAPPVGPIGVAALTEDYLSAFIGKLEHVASVEPHHLLKLLDEAAGRVPDAVVNLFLHRMDLADAHDAGPEYRAAPYLWHKASLGRISTAGNYRDLLRRLRDRSLVRGTSAILALPKLFAVASNGVDATAREVLLEWIESGDGAQIELAANLVLEAGERFVFDNVDFVARALAAARAVGSNTLDAVRASLQRSAQGGAIRTKHGSPGQPFPEDVALRQAARTAAEASPAGSDERELYEEIARSAEADIERADVVDAELDLPL